MDFILDNLGLLIFLLIPLLSRLFGKKNQQNKEASKTQRSQSQASKQEEDRSLSSWDEILGAFEEALEPKPEPSIKAEPKKEEKEAFWDRPAFESKPKFQPKTLKKTAPLYKSEYRKPKIDKPLKIEKERVYAEDHPDLAGLDSGNIRNAIVLSEILGPPISVRGRKRIV